MTTIDVKKHPILYWCCEWCDKPMTSSWLCVWTEDKQGKPA